MPPFGAARPIPVCVFINCLNLSSLSCLHFFLSQMICLYESIDDFFYAICVDESQFSDLLLDLNDNFDLFYAAHNICFSSLKRGSHIQ